MSISNVYTVFFCTYVRQDSFLGSILYFENKTYIGITSYSTALGFLTLSPGIFVGPAVAPAAMAILMEKASAQACTFGPSRKSILTPR